MKNEKTKIIIDTDVGCDCDDTGAMAMVHRSCEKGLCDLLAVTISTSNPSAAGCADAINRWYGRVVPVGQTNKVIPGDDAELFKVCYGKHIAETYPNSYYGENAQKPLDAVKLLRETLSRSDEKVTIVVIGSLVNMSDLLKSSADEFSPLSGEELVREKVRCFSLMCGHFEDCGDPEVWFGTERMLAECNVKVDIDSAKYFFAHCPTECVVSRFVVGWQMFNGNVLIENERKNPVAESYFVHSHGNRSSWDLTSAYYAIFGADELFEVGKRGVVTVGDDGVTTFTENEKGNFRLLLCPSTENAAKRIDEILIGN